MSKKKHHQRQVPGPGKAQKLQTALQVVQVDSLLDRMEDGKEFGSIVSLTPREGFDLVGEIQKALQSIADIRGRPCISYMGNVVRASAPDTSIDANDDLPFAEMITSVDGRHRSVDVFIATNGGSAHQVARFVNALRARFDTVEFLVPSFCMSAGTIFVLSGNRIWMTPQACLGPIDPQFPSTTGRFVPAQALLLLVEKLRKEGEESLKDTGTVPWTAVRIIDTLDKKELAEAMTASQYSINLASQFLCDFKFRDWKETETRKLAVSDDMRRQRALEIAQQLASHDRWKAHGHAISREVLWSEIQLRIDHPDAQLERAIRRTWALMNWIFDKTPVVKAMVADKYRFVRVQTTMGATNGKP